MDAFSKVLTKLFSVSIWSCSKKIQTKERIWQKEYFGNFG